MKKIYDAVVTTGKYKDAKGNEKTRYLTVGAVFEGDKGPSLKLESLPVTGFNGWINFYEPKARDEKPAPTQSAAPSTDDPNDDIPF